MRRFLRMLRRLLTRSRRFAALRQAEAERKHRFKTAPDFMRRRGQAGERFAAEERELGGLVPPATGPRPESTADEQARQRAQQSREPPGRDSSGRER